MTISRLSAHLTAHLLALYSGLTCLWMEMLRHQKGAIQKNIMLSYLTTQ